MGTGLFVGGGGVGDITVGWPGFTVPRLKTKAQIPFGTLVPHPPGGLMGLYHPITHSSGDEPRVNSIFVSPTLTSSHGD